MRTNLADVTEVLPTLYAQEAMELELFIACDKAEELQHLDNSLHALSGVMHQYRVRISTLTSGITRRGDPADHSRAKRGDFR
jgi:hypothetical protein